MSPQILGLDSADASARRQGHHLAWHAAHHRRLRLPRHGRLRNRERPPSKGNGKVGRTTCAICWRKIGPTQSAKDQHTYWNVHCLTWQQWDTGKYRSWPQAQAAAEEQKLRRERRHRESLAARPEAAAPALPSTSHRVPHAEPAPRPRKRKADKGVRKDKKDKKDKKDLDRKRARKEKGGVHSKAPKEKKDKGRNRRRTEVPWPSPSPEVERKRHRKPPSEDSDDDGALAPRLERTGPNTFKVVLGRGTVSS